MDPVSTYLTNWGLSSYIDAFKESSINEESLKELYFQNLIMEALVPNIGHRLILMKNLRVMNDAAIGDATTSPVQSPNRKRNISPSNSTDVSPHEEQGRNDDFKIDLKAVLKTQLKGQIVLSHYISKKRLFPAHRNDIVDVIIKHCIASLPRVTNAHLDNCAHSIVKLFKTEQIFSYYVAPKTEGPNQKRAKGKLPERLWNLRALMRKAGMMTNKPTFSTSENDISFDNDALSAEEYADKKNWLKYNKQPWDEIVANWKLTSKQRLSEIHNSAWNKVQDVFKEWPLLEHPNAYILIEIDFHALFKIESTKFFTNWEKSKAGIRQLLLEKVKDKNIKENLEGNLGEDCKLLMGLAYLFRPTSTGKKGGWKPSHLEMQEGFILHVKGDSGGPVVYLKEDKEFGFGQYTLAGIVSTGFGCGLKEFPGIYIPINRPEYLSWIKKVAFP